MAPWRVRLALAGVSLAMTLAAAELALRATALLGLAVGTDLRHKDPDAVQIEPLGTLGFRQRPGSRFTYANNTFATVNPLGYRGPSVAIPKPPGVYRIVLLGGSTTHGWSVSDSQTIDTYLRAALARRHPALAAEVINLAFDGYDSYQILLRWRDDAARFAPDLIVVNAGATDVGHARFANLVDGDPRVLLWQSEVRRLRDQAARGHRSAKDTIKHWLYLARLPQYLRELAWRRAHATPPAGRPPLYPDVADYFERHIDSIASEALAAGVAVLLSTDPSALRYTQAREQTEGRAYFLVDAATTEAYRDTLAKRMEAVASRLAGSGARIRYLGVDSLPPEDFMDDAHLTPAGNRDLAGRFLDAMEPLFPPQPAGR